MTTQEQIDDFTRFAKHLVENEGTELPLAVIFDRWHEEACRDEDLLRIQTSVDDYENGERGQPAEEVLAEFRAKQGQKSRFRKALSKVGDVEPETFDKL